MSSIHVQVFDVAAISFIIFWIVAEAREFSRGFPMHLPDVSWKHLQSSRIGILSVAIEALLITLMVAHIWQQY